MTPKELQEKIEHHRQEMIRIPKEEPAWSVPTKIATEHSEIFIATSRLAEISTRRIIYLTWGLLALTIALLALTAALYKDAHEQIKREQLKEHRDAQQP